MKPGIVPICGVGAQRLRRCFGRPGDSMDSGLGRRASCWLGIRAISTACLFSSTQESNDDDKTKVVEQPCAHPVNRKKEPNH